MTDPTLRRTQDLTCPNCGHTEYVLALNYAHDTGLSCSRIRASAPLTVRANALTPEMIFFYVCFYCNPLFRDEPLAKPHEETD